MMSKTIIVSNRLPLDFKISNGELISKPSVGGLATGLSKVHSQENSLWIGWSGLSEEEARDFGAEKVSGAAREINCVTVSLTRKDINEFYYGFSNKALWPLFHYFLELAEYEDSQWKAYEEVNRKFADQVLENASDGDKVWIHDYQLLLLPKMLRDRNPSLSIGLFLHIPFPAFEIFRTCPWRDELLHGMLGANLIGFHTYDYVQHFLNSIRRIASIGVKFNEIAHEGRIIKADSFPMGIDYDNFFETALRQEKSGHLEKTEIMLRLDDHIDKYPDSKLILSIDRMDYTKGIPNRIRAFEYFLEKNPQFQGKVRLVMLAVPSRSNVPQYGRLKRETDELVGRINGKFATIDWTPIWYFYRAMPFADLVYLYSRCHIALITPLRDGMNLVAKEFVACRTNADGVLILSEMAGAASELHEALSINPNNYEQFADAIEQALTMGIDEQHLRMRALQDRVSRYSVDKWANDFLKALDSTSQSIVEPSVSRFFDNDVIRQMTSDFEKSQRALILLDYDGTLVNFKGNPDHAVPDSQLYDLLDAIAERANVEVAIISGRGRDCIEKWFGTKSYTLISDHGIWLRRLRTEWIKLEDPKIEWKEIIRPIMENFVDRTPGSFVEEKNFSLVWHYRNADPDMSEIRMRELRILLTGLVSENGLSVLDGNKVLEVKNSMVNKGRAVVNVIANGGHDFIFAAGDDHTDEFMFDALPSDAYTVKVGPNETRARYFVNDVAQLRQMLVSFQ